MPEPELMLDPAQARAYAAADFEEPHRRCIELFLDRCTDLLPSGRALDLGCGPGDVTIRLAQALPAWTVDAIDGSAAMLDLARAAAAEHGVESRVRFHAGLLPRDEPPATAYDLLFSNSLLHHLVDPMALWSALARWGRNGATVFVMDLVRPSGEAAARALVERYAAAEPEILRLDFYNSLRAAYRPAEVRRQLADAGLASFALEVVSDRHLAVYGRLATPG